MTDLVVPCPVLVGRASESAVLAAALEAARAGRGGVVFVVGEAGIGKSRLVGEVASLATGHGGRVFRGRAVPGSAAAAFRPLTEALAPAVADAELDERLRPWLPALSVITPTVWSGPAVEMTAPLQGEAVLRTLRAVCGSFGVLVLEDLHWADPETLAVVEHLSDNLERAPVLCLATVRSEERSAALDLVHRVKARRTARVLELGRLNAAQVAAMVYSCTNGRDPAALGRIVPLADGVPFLVEELLASPGVPSSFFDTVGARLSALPEQDRQVLKMAAAFGQHFDWVLLPAATGLDRDVVVDALDRGVGAQLLAVDGDSFRFRHALTAEAVLESVSPPRRQVLASTALAALDASYRQLPAELREVAARLAEWAGQYERAGQLLRALGQAALNRGALHTATVALQRASRLLPVGSGRDEAVMRLVETLALMGRLDDALAISEDLMSRLRDTQAGTVHLRLAAAALTASRWATAAEHLRTARALIANDRSPESRASLALRQAELALGTKDTAGAETHAQAALDLARTEGLAESECEALLLLGRCARRSSLNVAEELFHQALSVAEANELGLVRLRALYEVGTIALLDSNGVDDLLKAQQLAEALGAMATATVLDIEIAAGYMQLHDLDGERRHGLRAVRHAGELGMDLIVAYGWSHVYGAAVLSGDQESATSAAAAARAAAPSDRDLDGLLLGTEVLGALVADDTALALALAERSTEVLRGSETAPPAPFRAAWPLLLAAAGHPAAARAIDDVEQAGVGVNGGARCWLAMARALLIGRDDPEQGLTLAIEADAGLGAWPLQRHLARRLAAQVAAIDGWEVPEGWLNEAEAWFRSQGYLAVAAACRALRPTATLAVPPAWAALGISRREAEVLELVAEGCSNREIAERLYLSIRTVEKHVEALLRKTATKTRMHLAKIAAAT